MKITRTFVKIFLIFFLLVILANIISPFFGLWNQYFLLILCFFLIFLFFLIYRKKDKGVVKFFKFLILLASISVVFYIAYSNFFASKEFNYFYDIGSEKDSLKSHLSPLNRISEAELNQSYRNITSQIVYFEVEVPRGSSEISIESRLVIPSENYTILLGARNKEEWSYLSKQAYNSLLDRLNIKSKFTRLNSKMPEINSIEEIPEGSVVASNYEIKPSLKNQSFNLKNFETNRHLRESHEFYIYLKDSLSLYAEKQDINWYDGEDILNISLINFEGKVLGSTKIHDDGIVDSSKQKLPPQNSSLKIDNLSEGVYILKFDGNPDTIITKIKLNTNKIVSKRIFSADSSNYLKENDSEATFYTKTQKNSLISFSSYHNNYLQNISIGKEKLELKNRAVKHYFNLTKGDYLINIPRSNVIIETQGFLTFSEENYFEPFKFILIKISNKEEELFGVDYLITDYKPSKKDGDWKIVKANFEMKDLYIKNGKLSLMLNIPHLSESKNETNKDFVGIDWLNITIKKDGILKKIRD